MKQLFTCMMLLIAFRGISQELLSSSTAIESCMDQRECLTVNNASYLFFDETRNEFYLKVDLSKFKNPDDTASHWLNENTDSLLYYKASLNEEDFPVLSNQNTKTLKLNGRLFFAGTWKDQGIELSVFPSENSIIPSSSTTSNNLRYDNYKVSFAVPVVPKDFRSYKQLYYNNQTLSLAVTLGRINLVRPGMEFHIKDVYYQSTR